MAASYQQSDLLSPQAQGQTPVPEESQEAINAAVQAALQVTLEDGQEPVRAGRYADGPAAVGAMVIGTIPEATDTAASSTTKRTVPSRTASRSAVQASQRIRSMPNSRKRQDSALPSSVHE